MRKRGFTLIELIVVMAIIAILVLLGVPKYKEYTKEAHLTKIKVNVKELESASMQYYMKHNDWPRLKDEPYTSEQIEDFGKQILDKTGAVVTLETDGNYYDIDFAKIKNYVKVPNDKVNYILQNPVGKVFFIEGITEEAKARIPEDDSDNEESEIPEVPIQFYGLGPEAFDNDTTTYTTKNGVVTWDGNLSNRKVVIKFKTADNFYWARFEIYDINGNKINFINYTDNTEVDGFTLGKYTSFEKEIIVPEDAVEFRISNMSNIFDISVNDKSNNPKLKITHSSNASSITLNWEQNIDSYDKAIIYKDGKFFTIVSGKSYTDKPLYSALSYTYDIIGVNLNGETSNKITYVASTQTPEVIFRGLEPSAFDKDNTTYTTKNGEITWEGNLSNKRVKIDLKAANAPYWSTFNIYDINGSKMNFMCITDNKVVSGYSIGGSTLLNKEIIVPDGAVKFSVAYMVINDIFVIE